MMRKFTLFSLLVFGVAALQAQVSIELLKDINPEDNVIHGSNPDFLGELNGDLYFVAESFGTGRELWKTDGSSARTTLFQDINNGDQSSDSRISSESCAKLNNQLYFGAYTYEYGFELWTTGGNYYDTYRIPVEGIELGEPVINVTEFNGKVYFASSGFIWQYTPGDNVAVSIANIQVSDFVNNQSNGWKQRNKTFPIYNNELYFPSGDELWKTNGTSGGTEKVFTASSHISEFYQYDSQLLFVSKDDNRLFSTYGTNASTQLIKDFGNLGEATHPLAFVTSNSKLYFVAKEAGSTWSLWQLDGNNLVEYDPLGLSPGDKGFACLIDYNYELHYTKKTDETGTEIWKTEGEVGSQYLMNDIQPNGNANPSRFALINHEIYFTVEPEGEQPKLYKTDGTNNGTVALGVYSSAAGFGNDIIEFKNNIYFAAESEGTGRELWVSNSTQEGTVLLKDIYSKPIDLTHLKFETIDGKVLFSATNTENGNEIWISDGTSEGTQLLKDMNPGENSSFSYDFPFYTKEIFGKQYFTAFNENNQRKLWETDGTPAGTRMVFPNKTFYSEYGIINSDSHLYNFNSKLWATDGTSEIEINSVKPNGSYYPINPGAIGNKMVFMANNGVVGNEPWVTDGTEAGTFLLKDICPGSPSGYSRYYRRSVVANNRAIFTANDGSHGVELWSTDGTSSGTILVQDLNFSSAISILKASGDYAYFTGKSGIYGKEVWVTQGTPETTKLLLDIIPGNSSSNPDNFTPYADNMVFTANDGVNFNLYYSNGTVAGTKKLTSLFPSQDFHRIDQAWEHNGLLYFAIFDPTDVKMEIWYTNGHDWGTRMIYSFNENPGALKAMRHVGENIVYIAQSSTTGQGIYAISGLTTGIENQHANSTLKIYPNPTASKVFVSGLLNGNWTYNITSLSGKIVQTGKVVDHEISCEALQNGVYILSLKSDTEILSQKLIKQ